MSIFSNLFSWVGKIFSKIWRAFKAALPYILLACALWVGFVGPLALTWLGLSMSIPAGWASALFFMGTSYLLAPEETTAVVSRVSSAVGDSATDIVKEAGEVGSAVGDALGSTLSSFFTSSGLAWVALAVGGYFLLSSGKDKDVGKEGRANETSGKTTSTRAGSTVPGSANDVFYGNSKVGGETNAISNEQTIIGGSGSRSGPMENRTVNSSR